MKWFMVGLAFVAGAVNVPLLVMGTGGVWNWVSLAFCWGVAVAISRMRF